MSIQYHACLLFAGLSAALAVPQQGQSARLPSQGHDASPTQLSLVDLSTADVLLEASTAEKPGSTPAAAPADSPKGKVVDVVLSTSDGQIACAAVSVGKLLGGDDRVVLVPSTVLQCTMVDKKPAYLLRMTKAELQSLPEFDIRKDGTDGLDRAVERARGLSSNTSVGKRKDSGEAGKKDSKEGSAGESGSQASVLTINPLYVLSSQLNDCGLSASDAEFGKVHDGVIDVHGNTVGYLLVSRGSAASSGTSLCVVPLRACRWSRSSSKVSLKLEKTSDQVKAAPEYKKPDQGLLTPDQMKGADALFGSGKGGAQNPQ
jgi:hypothetical protein